MLGLSRNRIENLHGCRSNVVAAASAAVVVAAAATAIAPDVSAVFAVYLP